MLEKAAELGEFALEIGVEQRLVAFASAPQNVVRAAELMGDVDRVLHLRRGVGEDVGVGIGRRARHEAAGAEQIGGAPQQLDLARLQLAREQIGDLAHIAVRLGERGAFRRDVAVVEGEERETEDVEHLEGDVRLELRVRHVVIGEPWPVEGRAAEHVSAGADETVPVADGSAEMILHALAEDQLVAVIIAEGERVRRLRPFVTDRRDVAEKARAAHLAPPSSPFIFRQK